MQILIEIIKDAGSAVYGILHIAVPLSVFFMFYWIVREEYGAKKAWLLWWDKLRHDREFQKMLLFVLYACIVLCITFFTRTRWEKWPLRRVRGYWTFHTEDGKLYLENVENIILFAPLLFLFWIVFYNKLKNAARKIFYCKAAAIAASLSICIEFSQWFFHKGTVQISDLFFNVLGGILGSFLYDVLFIRDALHKRKK